MALTKLVSNIIKNKVQNHLLSGFSNAISGIGNPKKLAAKLASKSPLDFSKSPTAHMGAVNNPYTYGSVYYPEETSNLGDGHYIIFDIIALDKSEFGKPRGKAYPEAMGRVGEGKLNSKTRVRDFGTKVTPTPRFQQTGTTADAPTHRRISDSIVLYTPATNTQFNYKVGYENIDTGLAKQIGALLNAKDILAKLQDIGTGFGRTVIEAAIDIALPGFSGFTGKKVGDVVNPNAELVFKSVPFRTFNFPFEFAPKNVKEKDDVQKILSMFKFHMMPELGGAAKGYLSAPSEFQITYMYREEANTYIPQISRCALTDMNVDYSPEGVFTTFRGDVRGAAPVLTKMELSFTEMEIMTKETIAAGM